jgi:hypothetical protein
MSVAVEMDSERHDGPDDSDHMLDCIGDELGPAMQALTAMQRRFVVSLYELPPGRGCLKNAAKRAGYGRGSNDKTLRQISSALWNNEKIRRAYQEMGYRYIGHTAVAAIKAARELLFQPTHPDHLKACKLFIDRGWPVESLQTVNVTHTEKVEFDPVLMQRLADELGVPLHRLIGWQQTKVIEGKAAEQPQSENSSNSAN